MVLTPGGFSRRESSEINNKRGHLCLRDPSDVSEHGTDRSQTKNTKERQQEKTIKTKQKIEKKEKNIISV